MTNPFDLEYSDNDQVTVGDRLAAEIEERPERLDVATGYLTPSVWAVVGEALSKLGAFHLLLGKDFELAKRGRAEEEEDVRTLVRQAIRHDSEPPGLPVPEEAAALEGLIEFLRRDTSDIKVWTDGFLHAKAYVMARSVGVGSANFTAGGLAGNRELVAWRQDIGVVRQFQGWFDRLWGSPFAAPYKDELIDLLERTRFGSYPWTPYDLLIRTLAERYGVERPASLAQAAFELKWFQEEAVFRLIRLLNGPARGALLADAVGLGKTFMALGVIHHFLYQATEERKGRGRPVLLVVPASLIDMWQTELEKASLDWACHVVSVQSLREGVDLTKYAGADLVVIDEAHRLRSGRVWYRQVLRALEEGAADKRVLLLTATPVHTSLRDITRLLQVMTKNRRAVWAPTIADFERYLTRVERREIDPFPLLDRAVVRRSRSDLIQAYKEARAAGLNVEAPSLPRRRLSHVEYLYVEGRGDDLFRIFVDTVRDLHLAPYDLQPFRKGACEEGSPAPPSSLVGLYVAGLLKRFESSLRAVRVSLVRLERLLTRFLDALADTPPKVLDLEQNPRVRQLIEREADEDEDEEADLQAQWAEILATLKPLTRPDTYDLDGIREATEEDLRSVARLLADLPSEDSDGKVAALVEVLTDRKLAGKRLLVFTQFRDTAEYVAERLQQVDALRESVSLVHGGVEPRERRDIALWFDPDKVAEQTERRMRGEAEPKILVSTDVLAEGHNLQLAQAVINFDLHWNPQVAVQRAGRIDRLNSPHKEVELISFLPDEGIDVHLNLVETLDRRFGLIHYLGLGDEPVTKLPADIQTVTFEQLRKLYADDENVLDEVERIWSIGSTDYMRAPLEQFLLEAGAEQLKRIPVGVQSVRHAPVNWKRGPGVFVAFKFEGQAIWRFYPRLDGEWRDPVTDEPTLFQAIACSKQEPRITLPDPPPGPGGVIDWDLLVRSARDVAAELTKARATADIARGASERSSKLRLELRQLAEAAGVDSDELIQLLDRLEQVRVEDYDARPGYEPFQERVRRARRAEDAVERAKWLHEAVTRGLELFGSPEQAQEVSNIEVLAEQLTLVSWEWLLTREPAAPDVGVQQPPLPVS